MTIEKGRPWGEAATLPAGAPIARTDAELRALIEPAWRADEPLPIVGLLGGDLCRTLGGPGDLGRLTTPDAMTFPIDLGIAELDDTRFAFVAHAVARRAWWHGRFVAAMNAQWLGDWDLGPRSHPNDGLLDLTDGSLPLGDRLEARRRARTGTHLPHPGLSTRRAAQVELSFDRPLDIWLDGTRVGRAASLRLEVRPDAFRVVI